MTPVKEQKKCGSCWTFSTVGALESHYLIKYKTAKFFSEQQLVDCAGAYDNNGCRGGLPSHAFEYISNEGGIAAGEDYPYEAVDTNGCRLKGVARALSFVGGSVKISLSENDLKVAVHEKGSVSVAFKLSQISSNTPLEFILQPFARTVLRMSNMLS